jgi:hypothetical protein
MLVLKKNVKLLLILLLIAPAPFGPTFAGSRGPVFVLQGQPRAFNVQLSVAPFSLPADR